MDNVYMLKFYDNDYYDYTEYMLYFSSLEKVDEYMDKWEKGIADVPDENAEMTMAHCYDANVYKLSVDNAEKHSYICKFERISDNPDDYDAEYHWHKVMPKEK